jgi:hypothetical protein
MRARRLLIAVLLVLLGTTPGLAQDHPWLSLSSSVNYSVGNYGTGKDTTLLYMPFTLGVTPLESFTVSLTVPYVHQTTQNVVITGGGVAPRNETKGKLARPARATTESGLGDVLVKASYVILDERGPIPEIAPYVKIKVPTADRDRGLGTGEFDETIGVDLSKSLLEKLFGYLSASYTFIGSPPGSDLRNSFGWSLGAAYAVFDPVSVFAFLDGATAISRGEDDPLELLVGAEYKLTKVLKLTGSVTRGLSKGSADWSVSAGLGLRF